MPTISTEGIEKVTLENIFYPISLVKVLDGLENTDAVHLVITANGSYQSVGAIEATHHHHDKRPRLLSEPLRTLGT